MSIIIMCGIAGILKYNSVVHTHQIKNMTDELNHRGPDGEGQWISNSQNIGLGHRRLSILDLSNNGKQPMQYANSRYTITFNGEIYNYIEIKKMLVSKGYSFKTETDTEVLIALFDLKRELCLENLDGMFSFAIWDEIKQELFCARDRFGEKPFFYFDDNNQFIFASEIKAIWKAGVLKEIENRAIYNYLIFGSIDDINEPKKTFYKNVKKLEPAHYLIVNKAGKLTYKKYWSINLDEKTEINIERAKEEFIEIFTNSIRLRLRSDVPVGSSLSGGLDSSSIVMLIDKLKGQEQEQKTFSARFENFKKDEGYFIKKVTNQTKSVNPFDVYPTEKSLIHNWNKIIYHQDEPFGSFSIAAQYEVMQLARKNLIPVLLDGQGADESLAGYYSYFHTYYSYLKKTNKPLLKKELHSYQDLYDTAFNKFNFKTKLRLNNQKFYNHLRKQKRKYLSSNHSYFVGLNPDIIKSCRTYNPPITEHNTLKDHLHYSILTKGIADLLRYADRNSMAHSVEVRLPFLSHHLVEFVFSLPEEMLIYKGWTKYILRYSMNEILPSEITWRKDKIGFEPPQNKWMENEFFKSEISDSIRKLKQQGVIHTDYESLNWKYLMLANYL